LKLPSPKIWGEQVKKELEAANNSQLVFIL
jgi:hypothetical protein